MVDKNRSSALPEASGLPLQESMGLRMAMQLQMVNYLADYMGKKVPGYDKDFYVTYVINVLGERYHRWFRGKCGQILDTDFLALYYDNPQEVVRGVTETRDFKKYLKGFLDRFKKKCRKMERARANQSVNSIRNKVAGNVSRVF